MSEEAEVAKEPTENTNDDKPKEEPPKEEEPKEEEPKEVESKEEAPKEELPKYEAPKEEAPKEEVPTEAPTEEAPKEEAPKEEAPKEEAPKEVEPKQEKEAINEPENDDKKEKEKADEANKNDKNDEDNKEKEVKEESNKNDDDNKTKDDDTNKALVDFTGSWELKSSSKSIDEYYKSEGWGYLMRKMAPMIPIKQIIKQDGNKLQVRVIVGPGGKFADETTESVIGSGNEFDYKDKDGPCKGLSKWNDDKTEIISDCYRVADKTRTYKTVRSLSTLTDKKMIITTTNKHEKT
eukprot:550914_1